MPTMWPVRAVVAAALAMVASLAWASPAAAHAVGGGDLPAPTWLLAYGGGALALITAVALAAAPRPGGPRPTTPPSAGRGATAPVAGREPRPDPGGQAPATGALRWLGAATYAGVVALAFIGPDSAAGNITTSAVLVVFWVGLPLLCLVAGDVFARINPFDPVVAALERLGTRGGGARTRPSPPTWSGAAFLALFSWFVVAYHRPGSPRALGVLLIAYALLAIGGGVLWGRRWLRTGEGFGALSAGVAHLRRPGRPAPPGLVALGVVWLGGTAFEAVAATGFWLDLLGAARGWERTILDTAGLVWVTAIATGAVLGAARLADHLAGRTGPATPVPAPLAAATLAVAASWFVLHDLTLLLFEGQNFLALASDPISRGWDLFGTIDRSIDIGVVEATWVRWTHLLVLLGGHLLAVVAAHCGARSAAVPARAAATLTWAAGALAAAGVVAASLLVLE